MASVNHNAPVNVNTEMNFDGLDIAALMMMVQSKRAELLESGLKQQMEVVKSKNSQISALQGVLQAMTTALAKCETEPTASIPSDAKKIISDALAATATPFSAVNDSNGALDKVATNAAIEAHYNYLAQVEGYTDTWNDGVPTYARDKWCAAHPDQMSCAQAYASVAKNEPPTSLPGDAEAFFSATGGNQRKTLDAFISNLNTKIDSLSNTQQMDMLRLQSSSNKRNEAIEMMSKTLDSAKNVNSGIVQKF